MCIRDRRTGDACFSVSKNVVHSNNKMCTARGEAWDAPFSSTRPVKIVFRRGPRRNVPRRRSFKIFESSPEISTCTVVAAYCASMLYQRTSLSQKKMVSICFLSQKRFCTAFPKCTSWTGIELCFLYPYLWTESRLYRYRHQVNRFSTIFPYYVSIRHIIDPRR